MTNDTHGGESDRRRTDLSDTPTTQIRTRADLEAALSQLIQTAYDNGVLANDSAYALQYDDAELPDWDVHLTRVAPPTKPAERRPGGL
ncbi:MAG: hypothetical protein ABEJ28_08400 [Salinigranum sp.]